MVAQFMHAPCDTHFVAVKRILSYLAGTLNYRLVFSPADSELSALAFANADWGGSIDDRGSVSGHGVFVGSNLVSWSSKKQKAISCSTMEAEYRSIADAAADVVWVEALLADLGVPRHRQPVEDRQLQVNYVPATHQLADGLTKSLSKGAFEVFRDISAMCKNMEASQWWWFRTRHGGSNRSLSELDNKTKAMLKLMEGDGDSSAQRAEMYCKNRPELINVVEYLYRSHRSLAELYDRVKSGHRCRLVTTLGSPFPSIKYISDKTYDSCSNTLDSEVDDPEHEHDRDMLRKQDVENEDRTLLDEEVTGDVPREAGVDEARKLREEVERLKEENENLKAESLKKDEG
ncbi:hypothetical protein F3Y22_tig00005459pilonHSYRG00335 [Hibiscus syriacus]|uniref:NAB domain-containing protein n=1 Tax=Hibiscus syriacus TaxID=106335 RepID=A0A6A3CEH5_HIBSY|nr:hypothetical protein F3Y22_tig00005459pilonHSYRG00335 [Hibiscus syriacus]